MAGDWMKVEKVTPDKPEILEIAGIVGLHHDEVFGKLYRLWSWADDQTEDGNARGVTLALLDARIGVTGFAKAMEIVGWLERIEPSDDCPRGGVRFVNFDRHNGQTAKKRALTAVRVSKHKKEGNAKGNAPSVTNALPREEKRREEKSINSLSHTETASPQIQTLPTPDGSLSVCDAIRGLIDGQMFPAEWRTPEVFASLNEWDGSVFRIEGRHLDAIRLREQLRPCGDWTASRLVRSIQLTIGLGKSHRILDADKPPPRRASGGEPAKKNYSLKRFLTSLPQEGAPANEQR